MYIRKKYSLWDLMLWTRWETLTFLLISLIATVLFEVVDFEWLRIPWTPMALIGTAVAFLIAFQNNAAYGRIWEARKIWGGIVNYSRSWAIMVKDTVTMEHNNGSVDEEEIMDHQQRLYYRHFAWLTALRHAMRDRKPWEVSWRHRTNKEWRSSMHIPEQERSLEEDLRPLIPQEEFDHVMSKTNKATALIGLQSSHIRMLKENGMVWEFSFLELEGILIELFNLQGKSERIKNFPYPRQYATLSYDFVWIFIILLPFGVIPEFSEMGMGLINDYPVIGKYFVWFSIPFSVIVSWVFHTMQRIGTVGENPFEGTPNDVPISTMSRGIEIDMREMLGEGKEQMPDPIPAMRDVQM